MESRQREAIFFVLILRTYMGLNMRVRASLRGGETDRGEINSCSCEWEKCIMQERMKVRKEEMEDSGSD